MIDEQAILSATTEADIYDFYLAAHYEQLGVPYNDFMLNTKYFSPFREENNPDFKVFLAKSGKLMFKDHASGYFGNVFDFVATLAGVEYAGHNKITVWLKIDFDLGLGIMGEAIPNKTVKFTKTDMSRLLQKASIPTVIRIWKASWSNSTTNGFTPKGLEYWANYGILNIETLVKFQVYQISASEIKSLVSYGKDDLVFAYNIANRFKILNVIKNGAIVPKKYKWQNNYESHYVEGWIQLDWNNIAITKILIITKAMKECMFFYELGYSAIAGKSETASIDKRFILYALAKVPDLHIVVWLDNDTQGKAMSAKYKDLLLELGASHSILEVPTEYAPAKDATDVVKYFGRTISEQLINNLLHGKCSTEC